MRNAVDKTFERRLAGLVNSGERAVLRGGRKGVERESLRVDPAGTIAHTPHPFALGAPLTPPVSLRARPFMTGALRSTARNPVAVALMGVLILVFLILGVGGGSRFPDLLAGTRGDAVAAAGSRQPIA